MTDNQFNKLDKCWFKFQIEDNCVERVVEARSLLGSGRFDLYAILLYIDSKVRGLSDNKYHDFVYHARTDSLTNQRYGEIGKPHKKDYEAYREDLDRLIECYINEEYDEARWMIPVDKNGVLIDGAHRVACAAYFDKTVNVLQFLDKEVSRVDSASLIRRLLPIKVADAMALEATKWHDDLYMLFFWPVANNKEKYSKSLRLIEEQADIVYEKEQALSIIAIRNLMLQLYGHMDWIGNAENGFKGLDGKVDSVWADGGVCHFILIRSDSVESVLSLKSKIREIYNCGLSSVHSTDSMKETKIAANALFNSNSIHFLEEGRPDKYKLSFSLVQSFKDALFRHHLPLDAYIIESGMSLGIYGARESNDLDYLCEEENILPKEMNNEEGLVDFDFHGEFLKFYNLLIVDLLYNPEHYFSFNEIKFVSLPTLLVMKTNRYKYSKLPKDKFDEKLIESLIGGVSSKSLSAKIELFKWNLKRRLRLLKSNMALWRNKALKNLGLYELVRRIVRKLR